MSLEVGRRGSRWSRQVYWCMSMGIMWGSGVCVVEVGININMSDVSIQYIV